MQNVTQLLFKCNVQASARSSVTILAHFPTYYCTQSWRLGLGSSYSFLSPGVSLSLTLDGLVEAVPVLPGGEVGGLVLALPQEHALVLRPRRDVLPVVTGKEARRRRRCWDISYFYHYTQTQRNKYTLYWIIQFSCQLIRKIHMQGT